MKWNYHRASELIEQQGRRLNWVANQIGVHPRTMARYLDGQSPTLPKLVLLAKALGVSIEELIYPDDKAA